MGYFMMSMREKRILINRTDYRGRKFKILRFQRTTTTVVAKETKRSERITLGGAMGCVGWGSRRVEEKEFDKQVMLG